VFLKDNKYDIINRGDGTMSKYVRVMDGLKSNAGGFEYKLDEVNIADKWNPNSLKAEETGGFNFGTEDKILRWLHRGDTIYDVIIPDDAEVIKVDDEKGIYRSNKIIVTNPRKITDEMVVELYKKSTLSNKIIAQCLLTLIWKNRLEISKYIIKDRVDMDNVNEILEEFVNYAGDKNLAYESTQEIYNILKEIQSPIDISLYVDKEPYIKDLTNDKIINLTGQSGSGKSTYASKHFNSDEYLIVDTDEILSEHRFENSSGINKELGEHFRNKYKELPNCGDDFDLIYSEILDYCKKYNKTIVIDCAQFHCIKDINLLKGKIIIIRTCIDTCYQRTINRFKENNPNYTNKELEKYMEKKKAIFKWYKFSNEFIEKINKLK
jgi:dephospho-CoA kinase